MPCSGFAFEYHVADEAELERAINRLAPGDTLQLAAGIYHTSIRLTRPGTAEQPIEVCGPPEGEAIIDAAGFPFALDHNDQPYYRFRRLTFRGADNGAQAEHAMVRLGSHWAMEDCQVLQARGSGLGVSQASDVNIARCRIARNGQIGVGISDTRRLTMSDCLIEQNNPGFESEATLREARISERLEHEGLWYVNPAWEAGGLKLSSSQQIRFERIEARENFGPGLWVDYANEDVEITACHAHHNRSLNQAWQGLGIMIEYNAVGSIVIDDCVIEHNEGAGIGIAESRQVRITGNQIRDDELEFRDMQRRSSDLSGIHLSRNVLTRSSIETSLGEWSTLSAGEKRLSSQANRWLGGVRYRWAGQTYSDLTQIQDTLGLEHDSAVEQLPDDSQ